MTSTSEILEQSVTYSGEAISVRSLEELIGGERSRQNQQVDELTRMHQRNNDLQTALVQEMDRLRQLSEELQKSRHGQRNKLAEMFTWLPWVKSSATTRRSIEDLLRRQFEMSSMRLREAADFADRLDGAKIDLYDEIDRLNRKIIESAYNEETAAARVLQLRDAKNEVDEALLSEEPGTSRERELNAKLDRIRRLLAEHTTKLKLYSTAEDRLAALKKNTRQLADTIAHLQADITRYVTAASEKLDLVAGQIQAIGAAADAANVVLELKQSLDAMTESLNLTTQFVVETQAYFRENVDTMIGDLDLYDEETEAALSRNQAFNESFDELDVEYALTAALASQIDALEEFDEEVEFHLPQEVEKS